MSSHQRDKNYRQYFWNIFTIFINLHHTNTHNIYTYIALKNREVSKLCPWPQCLHISLRSEKVCDRLLLCEGCLLNAVFLDKTLQCRDDVQHGCISSACCIVHNSTLVSSLRLPSLDTRAYRTKCKTECKNSCGLNSHGLLTVSCDSTKTTLPACTVQCKMSSQNVRRHL